MRLRALVSLYRRRLRVHRVQELLAGVVVAVAVALVFAVTVANGSIAGSAGEVLHTVIGPANLQLRARGPDGFDERLLPRVEHLPGVAQAAPLLEQTATVLGPHGRRVTVGVAGAEFGLAYLDGLAHTLPREVLSADAIALSRVSASELGIVAGARVTVQLRGGAYPLPVSAVLGGDAVGALSQASVAVMPIELLQRLAGLRGRATRILVQAAPGREAAVRRELETLAGGRLEVAAADQDIALLDQALRPGNQASTFFAATAVLLGFLFAFNAMLLTVDERRREIADLHQLGAHRGAIVRMVVFQALCLGLASSLVGLGAGYALSVGVFHQSPGYLARAFTLGTHIVIGVPALLEALVCGMGATMLGSTLLLLDLRRAGALDPGQRDGGPAGEVLGKPAQLRLVLAAICLLALTTAAFALLPGLALVVSVGLALTCVLTVPLLFGALLRTARALVRRYGRLTPLAVALKSLRSVTLRSLALAATGAVALFGTVALGGARDDLLRGLDGFAHGYVGGAAVWVEAPGDFQGIIDFRRDDYAARIARVSGVASVRAFQGSFLELGDRRIWVTARPPTASWAILRSQIVAGNATATVARLQEGGWVTVTKQIAEEHHATLGHTLTLPTPTGGVRFRIAALTTNFGWSPGAILMSPADYERAWNTSAPVALGVSLTQSASPSAVRRAIVRALGPGSGLEVLTAHERELELDASASEGLSRLGEISTLLVIAAILALATALISSIYQRRLTLAELGLQGARRAQLQSILIVETLLTLSAGALTGAAAGVYGEAMIDRYLGHVTGFPVASLTTSPRPLQTLALVAGIVFAVVTIPGWRASRVSSTVALDQ